MKKLLFLITEDWYFLSHRLPIARAARDAGFQVFVATHVENHGERIIKENFKLIPITLRRNNKTPFKEILSILELIKIYKSVKPDIVHQVAMKPVLYGTIAARIARVPVIVNALGGLGYIFISEKLHIKLLRFIISIAFKLVLNHKKNRLIIQNTDDIELLVSLGIVKREYIRLIRGSGVDISKFVPTQENEGIPIVALISRMLWDKGVKEFVDAAKLLLKEGVKARFVLIGNNDPDNPSSVPASALESFQKEGIVEWWGHNDDMPSVFQRCHVVCLPSYREGLPKVLIEAAACGRPIVATDVPGCREIVRNGENGFLVPVRDVNALSHAIQKLIEDPLLRKKMGMKGREIVVNEFTIEKVISETFAVYKDLLQK